MVFNCIQIMCNTLKTSCMENYICNAGFVNNEVTLSRDHCENGYTEIYNRIYTTDVFVMVSRVIYNLVSI